MAGGYIDERTDKMDKNQISKLKLSFDEISHFTVRWENFVNAIEKAKISCLTAGTLVSECFRDITKTSPMPNGGVKVISDIMLTRYACYLIAQNGDTQIQEIAFAQTYFAVQTRKQEVIEQRLYNLENS